MKKAYFFSITLLVVLAVLLSASKYLSDKHHQEVIAAQNKISATILADLLNKARQNYSQFALQKFKDLKPSISSGHAHKQDKNMLPNPATFAIELAEAINVENQAMNIWMYSNQPFAWRKDTAVPKSQVEQDALAFLQQNPEQIYSYSDDNRYFFGSAITMSDQSCVDCHNAHPASAKRDWQVGEVRAVLAVNIDNQQQAKSSTLIVISYIIYFLLFLCAVVILYLLNQQQRLDSTIEEANTDKLTGLYNRNYVNNYLIPQFVSITHGRSYNGVALMLIDFDHFKLVNDEFGHDVGDQCLVEMSAVLKEQLRDRDIAIRWGGEEFMIFIPDVSEQHLIAISERIRLAVANYRFTDNNLTKTVSIGVCCVREIEDPDFYAVVKTADNALYSAKAAGRNIVVMDKYKID